MEKTATAKREKAKREGTCSTGMGINGGYTEDELAKAKEMYPREFQQAKRRANKERVARKCPFCEGSGHMTRRSKKCGEHQTYLDSIANKEKGAIESLADNTITENEVDNAVGIAEDSIHVGDDTPAAQTARDASECELLDSMGLDDGNDDFFDCFECLDSNSDNESTGSDKENIM